MPLSRPSVEEHGLSTEGCRPNTRLNPHLPLEHISEDIDRYHAIYCSRAVEGVYRARLEPYAARRMT